MARKVNKKFLIVLTTVIMGALVALWVMQKKLSKGNAKDAWATGDKLFAEHNYKDAKQEYLRALGVEPNNYEGLVKFGDTLHQLVRYDLNELGKDVRAWERALEINPTYVPALNRLLDAYDALTELQRTAEVFNRLRDKAQALLRVDSTNLRARALQHVGILGGWVSGARTSEQDINASIQALIELRKKRPDDVEIPWYLAQAYFRQAADLDVAKDPDAAKAKRDQAVEIFEAAVKEQPRNAALAYRYFQVMATVLANAQTGQTVAERTRRLEVLLENARDIVKPEDREYSEIHLAIVDLLLQQAKVAEAEKKLEELLAQRPNDQRVRLKLATVWRAQPEKRAKALELMAQPLGDDPSLTGFRAYLIKQLDFLRLTELAAIRLDAYPETEEKDRPALKELIQEAYRKASAMYPEEQFPVLLNLKGRILLLDDSQQSLLEAIKVLQQALDKYEARRQLDSEYGQLVSQLAHLYYLIGESGQYKTLLMKLTARFPRALEYQKSLVSVFIREKEFEQARRLLAQIEKQPDIKDDPDLMRLRIALLQGEGNTKQLQELMQSLKEGTDREQRVKAVAAFAAGDTATAERLLVPLSAAEAQKGMRDSSATQILARLYYKAGRKEDAARVLNDAIAKNPKDARLKITQLIVTDRATPKQLAEFREKEAESIADPVTRAIELYQVARAQGKRDEALGILTGSEKANKDDPRLLDAIFNHALDAQQWDLAAQYADRLARGNLDQAGGAYYRTRLKLARHDLEGALTSAIELTRLSSHFSRNWILLGQAQQVAGQYEPALASYAKALDMQFDSFDALRGTVECHWELRQFAVARQIVERGMKISPNNPYYPEARRRLEELQGDPLTVTAEREKELQDHPDQVRSWVALSDNYSRVSDTLIKKNPTAADDYLAKAEAKLNEALKKWPDELTLYARLADLAVRGHKPEEGRKILEGLAAREQWKNRHEPWLLMANFYQNRGPDFRARAESALLQAVTKSQNDLDVKRRLVDFYVDTNRLDDAIKLLGDLVQTTKSTLLRNRLVELQIADGRRADAEKLLRSALTAAPNDPKLLSLLGFVKMLDGEYQAASDQFALALKADPQYAAALFYRGTMKKNRGDISGALADLQQARDLNSSNIDYHTAIADAYRRRGELENAAKEMEVAVQLSPLRRDIRLQLIQFYFSDQRWTPVERLLDDAKANAELAHDVTWWKLESQMWVQRNDTRKAMDAAKVAMKMAPEDNEVLYAYLEVLRKESAYQEIINLTDPVVNNPQAEKPWWLFVLRATAWNGLKKPELANGGPGKIGEYDRAMAAVDRAGDDPSAELVVKLMVTAFGTDASAEKLKDRKNPRWEIELVQVYLRGDKWQPAIDLLDKLLGTDFALLPETQQLKLLRTAAQGYAAASIQVPEAFDKAINVSKRYLDELERRQSNVSTQLEALNNLAVLLSEHPRSNNPKAALAYSQKAYNIMQQSQFHGGIADTHAWVLVLAGRLDEGIEILRTVISKDRAPAEAYYHLGEAYLRRSLFDEAQTNLKRAMDMFKEYKAKGIYVDPELESKVLAAMDKAKRQVKSAAAPAN
jgi:tetratricopeptide (TPR) repeat protein